MRVAALQFDVRPGNVEANLAAVETHLRAAGELDLVVLPEMWPTSFPGPQIDLERWLADTERALVRMGELAREHGCMLAGSSLGRVAGAPAAAPRNRMRVVDRGELVLEYDKVHLFSPTAETESFSAGVHPPPTCTTRLGRLSAVICYDLRFPQLTRRAFDAGAEVIVVSAQWPAPRATHWQALVSGLAVHNQCFVVACNRTGRELVGRRELELVFPGNSLIVDPHGVFLAQGRGDAGCVEATLDLDVARAMRRNVPVTRDQRVQLYEAWRAQSGA